ncbi:MAG TPA: YajQ family cyclic di-GMP-binding protein [Deltaproteobacteria bacterium]|nr:YajQ family cyclic di-GMP-binding protein [Deltaproteobacteria bacterium]
MPSFDIVSKVDLQEVDNAVNQAVRELGQRYDFKGSRSSIEWDKKGEIVVTGDDDYKLKSVVDIVENKLIKRSIPLKAMEYGKVEEASGGLKRRRLTVRQGIPEDRAKQIAKIIKEMKLKVQTQIQGDQLRVTGKKIDDLQAVIRELKGRDLDVALQFVNMRS